MLTSAAIPVNSHHISRTSVFFSSLSSDLWKSTMLRFKGEKLLMLAIFYSTVNHSQFTACETMQSVFHISKLITCWLLSSIVPVWVARTKKKKLYKNSQAMSVNYMIYTYIHRQSLISTLKSICRIIKTVMFNFKMEI